MSSRILVSLRVSASPQRAFEAFTGEIGLWWKPNGLFNFTPREPGLLSFELGEANGEMGRLIETRANGKVFEIGRIKVWDPPRRLVFGWRQATFAPDQDTEVEISFQPVGEQTRITVVHTGWDSVPVEHLARHHFPDAIFLQRHAEWWQSLLSSLNVRLAGEQ